MRLLRRITPVLAAAALAAGALPARAHVVLSSPFPRYGAEDINIKSAPCGRSGGARTTLVTTFRPGQSITVVFDEFVDHPGFFRIAFDASGDDDLGPPVLQGDTWVDPPDVLVLARIPDAPRPFTRGVVTVTLPDVECDACTLQVIQVMTDKPPLVGDDDFYFQCADLVLSRTAALGGPVSAAAAEDAGGAGGCATIPAARRPGPEAVAALLVVAVLRRRAPASRHTG